LSVSTPRYTLLSQFAQLTFCLQIAQLPPLSEQSQPLRLEQHHGQQQKQPEDHGDTASANVGCEHELVVCGQGRVKVSSYIS